MTVVAFEKGVRGGEHWRGNVTAPRDFLDFYETQRASVFGALLLYLGDRSVAEELTQETFIRVAVHWNRVRRTSYPHTWTRRGCLQSGELILEEEAGRTKGEVSAQFSRTI